MTVDGVIALLEAEADRLERCCAAATVPEYKRDFEVCATKCLDLVEAIRSKQKENMMGDELKDTTVSFENWLLVKSSTGLEPGADIPGMRYLESGGVVAGYLTAPAGIHNKKQVSAKTGNDYRSGASSATNQRRIPKRHSCLRVSARARPASPLYNGLRNYADGSHCTTF